MEKNLYVTTAIPYASGKPHIGHAIDYLLADSWARYWKQNGKTVRFQVGTDEHGNKVSAKALAEQKTPQEFADAISADYKTFIQKMDVEYTDFVRTTDDHHRAACQYIWQKLQPYIYKGTYDGWYCVGHEAFFTDKEVQDNGGICPDHQTNYQQVSEENYFLKCSAFTDQVREAIESKRMEIVPEFRAKEFLELMKDGLKDVSISRPKKSLSWGVPVPGDPEQVMYVWVDALANYITILGYPDNPEWQQYWPADLQVIGKDILRFHAGIWPPMLLGLGLELPRKMLAHGHVNVGGAKMSKTVGNVVDPVTIIDEYGTDAFRYFFARHIPTQDDGDFTWEKFEAAYNGELGNDLGNLVQRVASMLLRYQAGVIGDRPISQHDAGPYHASMEALAFDRALDEVWQTIRSINQYLETVKPWEIAKAAETSPEEKDHLEEVLSYASGMLLQIADQLVPFMPATAAKIHRLFDTGVVPADVKPLFPRLYLHTPDPRAPKAPTA